MLKCGLQIMGEDLIVILFKHFTIARRHYKFWVPTPYNIASVYFFLNI